jgi:hypothetical protein
MKLKHRPQLKKRNGAASFDAVVAEAVAVTRELRALDQLANAKLSPDAFLKLAIKIADTTPERLAELREKLERPNTFGLFELAGVLRRFTIAFRSPNWPGPSRELRRYNFLLTPEALSEIVSLHSTTFEIAALAALIATEQHPQDFGQCEDLDKHYKHLNDLALRRDELYEQIETAHTAADLLVGQPDSSGRCDVTFKLSGGAVSLGPHAGERLVNCLLKTS